MLKIQCRDLYYKLRLYIYAYLPWERSAPEPQFDRSWNRRDYFYLRRAILMLCQSNSLIINSIRMAEQLGAHKGPGAANCIV